MTCQIQLNKKTARIPEAHLHSCYGAFKIVLLLTARREVFKFSKQNLTGISDMNFQMSKGTIASELLKKINAKRPTKIYKHARENEIGII